MDSLREQEQEIELQKCDRCGHFRFEHQLDGDNDDFCNHNLSSENRECNCRSFYFWGA